MNKSEIEFSAGQREKLVRILDDFKYDLKCYVGNNEVFMVDDHIELADHLIANDVAPVVYAKWMSNYGSWYCSNCNYAVLPHNNTTYCPRCGAKMDLED